MVCGQLIVAVCHDFPIGLDEAEAENFYASTLKPLIRSLYARQEWSFCAFLDGATTAWLKTHRSEAIKALAEMAARKQFEPLGGPIGSALLPMLSLVDKLGQLEASTIGARENFNRKPRGAYLPCGVWEPSLPFVLRSCDFEYALLPASLFAQFPHYSGLDRPHIVEEMGKSVQIYPYYTLNDTLSADVEAEYIMSLGAGRDDGVLTLFFSGYNGAWLEKLLSILQSHGGTFTTPSGYAKKSARKLPSVYLPASTAAFFGGSDHFYRNFLFKRHEARKLYAKARHSGLLAKQIKGDKSRKLIASEEIWKGENHQFYWISRFGGIANPHMRAAAYSYLLRADSISREAGSVSSGVVSVDFDFDGAFETIYQGPLYNCFTRNVGGCAFEFDLIPASRAYLTIYNDSTGYPDRGAFHDLFFSPEVDDDEDFLRGFFDEGPFREAWYERLAIKNDMPSVTYHVERLFSDTILQIEKKYLFHKHEMELRYVLSNQALGSIDKFFAVEINWALTAGAILTVGDGPEAWTHGVKRNILDLWLTDESAGCRWQFSFSREVTLRKEELFNRYVSNGSEKRDSQGISLLIGFRLTLAPGASTSFSLKMKPFLEN